MGWRACKEQVKWSNGFASVFHNCGTFLDSPLSSSELYTAGGYFDDNPTWHVEDSPWKAEHIRRMIEQNRIAHHQIAEIGCGAGEILVQLQKTLAESTEFFGYDISPQAISMAESKANSNLKFFCEDLLMLDKHFDLLLVIDVIEHVEDYLGFMRSLKSKASQVILHIPLDISSQAVVRKNSFLNTRAEVGHLHYFTEETALASIRDSGFEVVDHFLTAGSVELSGGGFKRKLASLPRSLLSLVSPSFAAKLLGGFSVMALARPLPE